MQAPLSHHCDCICILQQSLTGHWRRFCRTAESEMFPSLIVSPFDPLEAPRSQPVSKRIHGSACHRRAVEGWKRMPDWHPGKDGKRIGGPDGKAPVHSGSIFGAPLALLRRAGPASVSVAQAHPRTLRFSPYSSSSRTDRDRTSIGE